MKAITIANKQKGIKEPHNIKFNLIDEIEDQIMWERLAI